MNDTAYNDYILIKANPVISDYDDRKITHRCNSHQSQLNILAVNNLSESNANGSNRHWVTTRQLFNSQRPRSLDTIEIVPAAVYGPLPFS